MSVDNILAMAKTLVQSGDLEGAEAALSARTRVQPVASEVVLLLAEVLLKLKQPEQAVALLQRHTALRDCVDWLREYSIGERMNATAIQLLESLPKSGSIEDLIDQAALMQIKGDARAAAFLCRKVLAMQPNNAFALNHLGRALFNAGAAEDARQAFDAAVREAPSYFQAWHNLGHVRRAKGDFKGAEAAYQKAVGLAPYYQSAWLNLALLRMGSGDNGSAVTHLEKLLEFNPAHAEAWLNLGICRQIQREFEPARKAFEQALQLTPEEPRLWRHMAGLHRELLNNAEAITCFRKALALTPNDSDLWAELISTLELQSDLDGAETAIAEGLKTLPFDINILFESAKIERRRGKAEDAYATLKSIPLQKLHPRLHQAYHFELATAADRNGHYDEAMAEFGKGNAMASTSIRARQTDKGALARQITAVSQWLEQGAPTAEFESAEDTGADLCFLIGFPRSGTTLLDVMLDGHSNVLTLEEKPTIERVAFRLDRLPGHYPFAMETLGADQRRELRALYREQIADVRLPEHAVVIDKMPIRTVHAAFMHRLFPEAKFLFTERHPCDVVLSNYMQNYALNEAMIQFARLDTAVSTYDAVMQLWQKTLQKLPGLPVHSLQYEALIEAPEQTLRGVCDFLGIAWQSGIDQHRDALGKRGAISTNSYHQVSEPIYQRSKFRWVNYHTYLQPYMKILKQHIDRMGY